MTSRLISEAFIPSVPIVIPSETAMELNSMGVPPASRTPSFTDSASSRRWKLQGIASIHVFAMPTVGRRSASSSKPIPFMYARAAARSGPSKTAADLGRGRSFIESPTTPASRGAVADTPGHSDPPALAPRSRHCPDPAPAPLAKPDQVPGHLLRIHLPARDVHVGERDQVPLPRPQRHPLGEDVVGVREPLGPRGLGAI